MKRDYKTRTITAVACNDYMWDCQKYMATKIPFSQTERAICPLKWYIQTGRAGVVFLRALFQIKPYVIGRILMAHINQPEDIVMAHVKAKVFGENANCFLN